MKKLIQTYGWILKIISAVFVLVLAIVFITNQNSSNIIMYATGGIILLLGLVRVYPLIKSLDKKLLRVVNIVEIVIEVVVGVILIILANNVNFRTSPWFGYLTGAVLYVRALVYFISVILFHEKTDKLMFWFAIILITVGVMIASRGFTTRDIVWYLFGIGIVSALYLGGDGFLSYRRYRFSTGKIKLKTIKPKEVKEEEIKLPPKEEDQDHPDIVQ